MEPWVCRGRCSPLPLSLLSSLLLLLAASAPGVSAGLYASDDGNVGRYSPFLDRLVSGHGPSRYSDDDDLLSSDDLLTSDGDRYRVEPLDDDWVQLGPGGADSERGHYEPVWSDVEPLEDDWPPLRAAEEPWPRGPLPDPADDDWVQIGSPEDGVWGAADGSDRWHGGWMEQRDDEVRKTEREHDRNFDWSDQDPEQDQEEQAEFSELEKEKRADHDDLAAELARSRPDPVSSETDTAHQLDQIRHAFRNHAADIQPPPQAAALRTDQGSRTKMKRLAAGAGGSPGATGRQQYMPWLLIAGIAVGTVATVLGAIVVVRRVRGAPGKVVTQQWIPHHALRMSTGSADIQPGGGRAGDQTAGAPIRIKAKGLLERRCSNSSLTIQLQQTEEDGEPIVVTSPATHSEAAEYLASAGNRLSRRELRQTEENVAALQAEFWDIPLNFPDKCDVVGASTKNRYKTVLPNEHTRVTLPGVNEDPLSSYINANWIRGYDNEERAYIATQGPLAHTLEDFWLMVLSRRAPAVVMITKLRENGRIKCAGYLPETRQKATFGKIEVTVKRILPRNGYTLRHVTVKRGKEQLQLQHFWFTAWPDHRTPDDSQQLLQMAAEVESARRDSEGNPTGPVVVHCSAGIGRTGCLIAISIGTSQLMEEGGVDVLGIVCGMRRDRGGMVQTAEQYIFIHRALRDFEASLPALEGSARSTN